MRSLSPYFVRELLAYFKADALQVQKAVGHRAWQDVVDRLEAALKPKRSVQAARKVRTRKRQTRKERVAEIREAVLKRANGQCECGVMVTGASHGPLQVDHFYGGANRRTLEAVETCWALGAVCHRLKTRNQLSAGYWLEKFIVHAELQAKLLGDKPGAGNYLEAARMARARLDALHIQEGRT